MAPSTSTLLHSAFRRPSVRALERVAAALRQQGLQGPVQEEVSVLNTFRLLHLKPLAELWSVLSAALPEASAGSVIMVQRLKRLPTIISKLQRQPEMRLARIQDLGGMRIITGSAAQACRVAAQAAELLQRSGRFELLQYKDYIASPKADGYRGLHLILRYHNAEDRLHHGLRLELQLRSRLQHVWASGVELCALCAGADLKSGLGGAEYRQYLKIASALLSLAEGTALPAELSGTDRAELAGQLSALEGTLRLKEQLQGLQARYCPAVPGGDMASDAYSLLELGRDGGPDVMQCSGAGAYRLQVLSIEAGQGELGALRSFQREQELYAGHANPAELDTCCQLLLTRSQSFEDLKEAYPNYFLQPAKFIELLQNLENNVLKAALQIEYN